MPQRASDPIPERLATQDLFGNGTSRIHVNHPLHRGDTPLHDHDFIEIAIVTAGQALHREIGGQRILETGDVVILLPGHWHAWEQCHDLRLFNICLTNELLHHELRWTLTNPSINRLWFHTQPCHFSIPPAQHSEVLTMCRKLQRRNQSQQGDAAHVIADCLHLLACISPFAPSHANQIAHDDIIDTIMHDMRDDLAHDWGLRELAQRHQLEHSYLGRRFRNRVGTSPMAWLAQQRCEHAAVLLLTTSLPVAHIGADVGWADPNYFARKFKATMGVSPSRYRAQLPVPAAQAQSHDWIQWHQTAISETE